MRSDRQASLNRLKTVRGQLDGLIRMVEDDAYCPEVMKQLAAVQGILDTTSREVLRTHLETCVAEAMQEGRTTEVVDELMDTLRYDKRLLRVAGAGASEAPAGHPEAAGTAPTAATGTHGPASHDDSVGGADVSGSLTGDDGRIS